MPVYLLCFDKKFRHAKHYIGFVQNMEGLPKRLNHHKKGTGSKLIAAVSKAGIGFQVARIWEKGDRNFERKLKNRKKSSELCPICIAAKKEREAREKVIAQENLAIAELNKPPTICPVIQTFSSPSYGEDVKRLEIAQQIMEVSNAQPTSPAVPSGWQRVRNSLARFWKFLTS